MELRNLLENPEFYEENCLLPHSNHNCRFPNEGTPRELLLDGVWRFHFAPDLSQRISDFECGVETGESWGSIPVPGCINLCGYGSPQYVNKGTARSSSSHHRSQGRFRSDSTYGHLQCLMNGRKPAFICG